MNLTGAHHRPAVRLRALLLIGALITAACSGSDEADEPAPSASASSSDATEDATDPSPTTSATEAGPEDDDATASAAEYSPADDVTSAETPNAERILVDGRGTLDAALALGLPVAGSLGSTGQDSAASYLPADQLSSVEIVGDGADINFEIITAFGADALLASAFNVDAFGYRDQVEAITRLEAVEVAPLVPWQDTLREIGAAFGVPQRAEARIAEAETLIADLAASLTDEQRALEVSVIRCRRDNCRYQPGGTSFAGQVLDDMSVSRPAVQASDAEGRPTVVVSFEQIDLLSGEVVILFGTEAEDALEALQDSALWALIPAVQNGHVFLVNEDAWFFGNVIAAEYIARDIVDILQTVAPA